jgi:NADH dehydrogenase FAD-containing subunit
MARVLPLEDDDISSTMERELKKRGVTVLTGTTVRETGTVTDDPSCAHLKMARRWRLRSY